MIGGKLSIGAGAYCLIALYQQYPFKRESGI